MVRAMTNTLPRRLRGLLLLTSIGAGCAKDANIGALGSDAGPNDATPAVNADALPASSDADASPPGPSSDAASSDAIAADAEPPATGVCNADHWCWENPLPQGNDLFGGTGDLFVGASGTIVERGASGWQGHPGTFRGDWRTAWKAGAETWVAGDLGTLIRFPSMSAVVLPTPRGIPVRINQVWGLSPTDVWAVGEGGTAFHYDGSTWFDRSLPPMSTNLYGVWGASSDDIWAVGTDAGIVHWDGMSWTTVQYDPQVMIHFLAIWGASASDIWAVGAYYGEIRYQTIAHYDGHTWTSVPAPTGPAEPLVSIWGTGARDIWAVGHHTNSTGSEIGSLIYHYQGATWTEVPVPAQLSLGWVGGDASGAWACGRNGVILHLEGGQWTLVSKHNMAPELTSPSDMTGIWGAPGAGVYAAGGMTLLHSDGNGSWSYVDPGNVRVGAPIWGSGPGDVWMAGTNGNVIVHYDGASYLGYAPDSIDVTAIWGSSPDDVWAGSDFAKIMHWDGTHWSVFDQTYATDGLWGSGARDIWGITNNAGIVKHWDGNTWSVAPAIDDLGIARGIAGTASDDVWLTGDLGQGRILHFDGTRWTRAWSGATARAPNGVWAHARNDAWVVGTNGLVLHWDGMTWSEVQTGTKRALIAVWGGGDASAASSVWAVGEAGTILRYQP
jgi:hypothetical protein